MESQQLLFSDPTGLACKPFRLQLLKWIGNKQRFAHEIASYFPAEFGAYYEPFLGSGAVLGTLAPKKALASDVLAPLVEIWLTLKDSPETLNAWYEKRWHAMIRGEKKEQYEKVKASYNARPNGADLVFLCRACYGGVVRFRQADGHMSTPCGIHSPVSPKSFAKRVDLWHKRTAGTRFAVMDFEDTMDNADPGDLVYCDPPVHVFSKHPVPRARIQPETAIRGHCPVQGPWRLRSD